MFEPQITLTGWLPKLLCHPESCLTTFSKIFDFEKNVRFPAGSNHHNIIAPPENTKNINLWGLNERQRYFFNTKNAFGPSGSKEAVTRDKAMELCVNNQNCISLLILYDNFEFKDDYPYKF